MLSVRKKDDIQAGPRERIWTMLILLFLTYLNIFLAIKGYVKIFLLLTGRLKWEVNCASIFFNMIPPFEIIWFDNFFFFYKLAKSIVPLSTPPDSKEGTIWTRLNDDILS